MGLSRRWFSYTQVGCTFRRSASSLTVRMSVGEIVGALGALVGTGKSPNSFWDLASPTLGMKP